MESYSVDLGTYNLFNVSIDLIMIIEFTKMQIGYNEYMFGAEMRIPLPENYPLTEVGTSEEVKSRGLFDSNIQLIDPKSNFGERLNITTSSTINLANFYNVAKERNIPITYEESVLFNGLGKRFICIAFPYIIDYFSLDPDDTTIVLQASGGSIRNDIDRLRIQKYILMGNNEIIQIYKTKYPEYFNYLISTNYKFSLEELVTLLVELENNEKLVHYYTMAFGFEPITYISPDRLMATKLTTFLRNCNK